MKLKWNEKELIGKGGNGKVYQIENTNGERFAVKILSRAKGKSYQRFKDEIKILNQLEEVQGVIKIIDFNLPDKLNQGEFAYYLMPLATRLEDYLIGKRYEQFYSIILKLADTLVRLHDYNITHRDIKPDNILVIDNQPVFSDFGLAHFPKKEKVSGLRERIGAIWTIAPEMKRISSSAQFKKADIYSFAKTLWILITNQRQGFEGQYISKSTISIDNFVDLKINDHYGTFGQWRYESLVLLESLIKDATDNDPELRPTALDFFTRLSNWYNTSSVLARRNQYEWEHCLERIFPVSVPESSSWSKSKEIKEILKLLSNDYDQLNYAFLPEHGGIDITNVDFANENDGLIINNYYIINPKRLIFQSMGNLDFSYFYMQLNELLPLNSNYSDTIREPLFLTDQGKYSLDNSKDKNKVFRYLGGSLVITRKTSFLNKVRGNFDGHFAIQDNKTPDQYKAIVEKLISLYNTEVIIS